MFLFHNKLKNTNEAIEHCFKPGHEKIFVHLVRHKNKSNLLKQFTQCF